MVGEAGREPKARANWSAPASRWANRRVAVPLHRLCSSGGIGRIGSTIIYLLIIAYVEVLSSGRCVAIPRKTDPGGSNLAEESRCMKHRIIRGNTIPVDSFAS